jgi:hypothetical protein
MESIVAIVKAAASMPPAMRPNSEHAIDRAHRTADTRADRTADDGTDRTGRTGALARTSLGTADDALRVPDMGDRQQGESQCRRRKQGLCRRTGRRTGWQRHCPDLRVHLDSLCSMAPADGDGYR